MKQQWQKKKIKKKCHGISLSAEDSEDFTANFNQNGTCSTAL